MARFVFIVQGEGRGHMSQAIAMRQFLERNNHSLNAIYLGIDPNRSVPDYFMEFGKGILKTFRSPGFVHTPDNRGINISKSFINNFLRSYIYRGDIKRVAAEIEEINPDFVINFYDLPGSYVMRKLPDHITKIAISHHFYLGHKDFKLPRGNPGQRFLLKKLNSIMRRGCDRIGALSFREGEMEGNLLVIPPLIREEYKNLTRSPGKRNLVYLLHPGYLADFVIMAREDPTFEADLFLDGIPDYTIPPNISLHLPDDKLFMEKMQKCNILMTTSGFDTIAEAALHSIPVIAVPVRNHYEQRCNAIDMERAGIGKATRKFNPNALKYSASYDNRPYLEWINQSEKLFLQLIEK